MLCHQLNIHKYVTNDLSQYIYQYQESILLWTLTSYDIMYH